MSKYKAIHYMYIPVFWPRTARAKIKQGGYAWEKILLKGHNYLINNHLYYSTRHKNCPNQELNVYSFHLFTWEESCGKVYRGVQLVTFPLMGLNYYIV